MKRNPLVLGALVAALAFPAAAQQDAVTTRQALMDSNGASAGVSAGVMKGEIAYSPAVGKAAIEAMNATAQAYGAFFPEGTDAESDSRSAASPGIWTDRAGFETQLGQLQAATEAAKQASGREGPADAAAFAAVIQPVLGTCRSCHEAYRVER